METVVRAKDRPRTGDLELGRLPLYQLSYFRKRRTSLNLQGLIRTLLSFHTQLNGLGILDDFFVEVEGFEPTTPCVQGKCSSQLSYTPKYNRMLLVYFLIV